MKRSKVKVSFRWRERKPLSFTSAPRTLEMKVGKQRWDIGFDVLSLLADAKVTLTLEVEKRPVVNTDGRPLLRGIRQC